MNTIAVPRITPGMTLAVEQADYCYGTGMALLVVRSIPVDPQTLLMLEWVLLHCVRLRHDRPARWPPRSALPDAPVDRWSSYSGLVRLDDRSGLLLADDSGARP